MKSIAAILHPNIRAPLELQEDGNQGKTRKLLNGNIEQVGNDLPEISDIGVDQAALI
jgi:hypothetical protein